MDPALLREREAFKKRAIATPTVENKKKKDDKPAPPPDVDEAKKKSRPPSKSAQPKIDATNYMHMTGSSQYKFGVLAKIVRHLRNLYLEGSDAPLTLQEILDETNQLDVSSKIQQWLGTEALPQNPKVETTPDGRFSFRPPYKIHDKRGLLKLLKQHDLKGMGGILLDDIQESLPNCEKILKVLQNEIIYITRPIDKKKILFYNDRTAILNVDEEFQKLWRAAAVDGIDDNKIEEYLEKQGIRSMQDTSIKTVPKAMKRKNAPKKRAYKKPRDNEHLADVLETYDK